MAKGSKKKEPKQRDPVRLSKDEYIYPPSKKALRNTLIAIAVAVVILIIRSLVRTKKQGKGTCSCGCSHCAMKGKCHCK